MRPSKDEYFLQIAKIVSIRSHDITKHGCVIVLDDKIIATGYNGFPKNLQDDKLPLTRPEKYKFIIHSEINAIYNSTQPLIGATAYVTGECCFNCFMSLYQAGIERIVCLNKHGSHIISNEDREHKQMLIDAGLKLDVVEDTYILKQSLSEGKNIEFTISNRDILMQIATEVSKSLKAKGVATSGLATGGTINIVF